MRTGFDFPYLINYYISQMAGVAYSRAKQEYLPVPEVFTSIMQLLNGELSENKEDKAAYAQLKDKVLGKTSLKYAPDAYWDVGMLIDLGIAPHIWETYPIHDRAQITARIWLKNAVDVIDAYYRVQDEEREKLSREIKAKNKAKH